MNRIPVGILGATGMVGQRLVAALHAHPWFELAWVAASERSTGRPYAAAARWQLREPVPAAAAALPLAEAAPPGAPRLIFSALDADAASRLEPAFAHAGHIVVSNASAFRMHDDVPLLVPEINPGHLALLDRQAWHRAGGALVTNPNCSVAGLVLALAPLERAFGLERVQVTTLQAVSGAGYPGVPALDILGNVIPLIAGEEEKVEREAQRILGALTATGVAPAPFIVSAQCHRVPVLEGHGAAVSLQLRRHAAPAEVAAAWREFRGRAQELELPTAPAFPVLVAAAPDRPQPRFDLAAGAGMSVTVGRLRPCPLLHYKFSLLVHNTIRGAAGAALLNAELLRAEGRL